MLTIRKKFVKKLVALLVPLTLALTACVSPQGTDGSSTNVASGAQQLGMAVLKVGIQAKCVSELENNTYWKVGSKLLTDTKKNELQTEVCSCVGEKATTSVTATELLTAALDKTSQATLAAKVVTSTLNACVVDVLKN